MALGEYGTTLLDELNRLANGGTYRAPGAMVGEALAARLVYVLCAEPFRRLCAPWPPLLINVLQ